MSCSTVTDPDIFSKSTCSGMLDSGLLEEEQPHHSGEVKGEASSSATKLDSGYIEPSPSALLSPEPPDWESQLLGRKLGVREMYAQDDDGDTLLHVAVMEGWTRLLLHIIRETPHPDLLDIQNDLGRVSVVFFRWRSPVEHCCLVSVPQFTHTRIGLLQVRDWYSVFKFCAV